MRPLEIVAPTARANAFEMHDLAIPVHRFSVDDYARMTTAGILAPDDRTELLDGRILERPMIGSNHASIVARLNRVLTPTIGEQGIVNVQNPIRLDDYSAPVPDVMVLRPRRDFYSGRHPEPEDVLLAIEVSDASLRLDIGLKIPLYARAAIPEVWIVDLQHRRLNVHRLPKNGRYEEEQTLIPPAVVGPTAIEGVDVDLAWLFG